MREGKEGKHGRNKIQPNLPHKLHFRCQSLANLAPSLHTPLTCAWKVATLVRASSATASGTGLCSPPPLPPNALVSFSRRLEVVSAQAVRKGRKRQNLFFLVVDIVIMGRDKKGTFKRLPAPADLAQLSSPAHPISPGFAAVNAPQERPQPTWQHLQCLHLLPLSPLSRMGRSSYREAFQKEWLL